MTNSAANPLDAVASLMLERQRIEQWLAALDAKKAITPPQVFERVRSDYSKRLNEVLSQLAAHTVEVEATITTLTARLGKLQSEETSKRDQRYEAELRAAVGEFTPEAWQEYLRRSDEEINRCAAERASVSTELARLQQILSMAGGLTAPPSDGAGGGGEAGASVVDELEFLKSVIDPRSEGAARPAPGATPARRTSKPVRKTPPPEPLRSPTPASAPASPPRPIVGTDGIAPPPEGPPLREPAAEPARTLKCQKCGAMNAPTEWHCASCGSELAAT